MMPGACVFRGPMGSLNPMWPWVAALVGLLALPAAAAPLFHGQLAIRPGSGPFDRATGDASLKLTGWDLVPNADSNGIAPERETVVIALDGNDQARGFSLPPGALRVKRGGKVFTYRAGRGVVRGIAALKITRVGERYRVNVVLKGLDLSKLVFVSDVCLPMAVVIGDDDGFTGVQVVRPGADPLRSRRVRLEGTCQATTDWPWV